MKMKTAIREPSLKPSLEPCFEPSFENSFEKMIENSQFCFHKSIKSLSQTNFFSENFAEIYRIQGNVDLKLLEKKLLLFLREPEIKTLLPYAQGFLVSDSICSFLLIYGFADNIPACLAQDILYQLQLRFDFVTWTIYRAPKKQKDDARQIRIRRLRSLRGAIRLINQVIDSKPKTILPLHADYDYFEYNYQVTKLNKPKNEIAVSYALVGNKNTHRDEILQTFFLFQQQLFLLLQEENKARSKKSPHHSEIIEFLKSLEIKLDFVKKEIEKQLIVNF